MLCLVRKGNAIEYIRTVKIVYMIFNIAHLLFLVDNAVLAWPLNTEDF